jgi:FkbM family methyltransferase
MKSNLLRLVRKLIRNINLPGRYVLSEVAAKVLVPATGFVEGSIGAYRISCDFRDLIQRQIYFGLYDQAETRLVRKLLKPGDGFFDVGANVGYYSLVASQIIGNSGRVHAFEPIAENVAAFKETITVNSIANIIVNQVAVGAADGSLTLYVGDGRAKSSGWASQVLSESRPKALVVDMISLDGYIQREAIDHIRLVKLDIEGAERDALLGMQALLSQPDAPDLLCEINPYLLGRQNLDSRALTRFLADHGYFLYQADKLTAGNMDPDKIIVQLINLFCTKNPAQIENLENRCVSS